MTQNEHDQARQLIATGETLLDPQQAWLRAHVEHCDSCRRYSETLNEVVRTLRSAPIAADSRLVRATQMRVRFHAARLRETRERLWLVGLACVGAGISMSLTAPFLWRMFAWIGEAMGVSTQVWQAAFILFLVTPVLVVGVVLLARRGHLVSDGQNQWR